MTNTIIAGHFLNSSSFNIDMKTKQPARTFDQYNTKYVLSVPLLQFRNAHLHCKLSGAINF